jgi:hypothetical protein
MNITPIGQTPYTPSAQDAGQKTTGTQAASDTGVDNTDSPSTIVSLSGATPADNGDTTTQADDATAKADDGQPTKAESFAHGVLGLNVPKSDAEKKAETPEQQNTDTYYSAGRIAAAAVAVGAVISVLV